MSIIDLMANDVWSDADITRRTESMIRSEFSAEAETILNRKVSGMVLGIYAPTDAEMIEMGRYQMAVEAARVAGQEARADMAMLLRVFPLEEAHLRLDCPDPVLEWERLQAPQVEPIFDPDTGEVMNREAVELDEAERSAALVAVSGFVIVQQDGQTTLDPLALDADRIERTAAQAVIDQADPDALALLDRRRGVTSGEIAE